jgi:hypothetical protein
MNHTLLTDEGIMVRSHTSQWQKSLAGKYGKLKRLCTSCQEDRKGTGKVGTMKLLSEPIRPILLNYFGSKNALGTNFGEPGDDDLE